MIQMSETPIKKQRIGLIFLLLTCLSMPLGASAQQYTLTVISGDGQIGRPGQTLQPFVVEVRDQNGDPAVGVFVTFLPSDGSLNTVLDVTGADGRAEATLTLGDDTGTTTVTVSAGTPPGTVTFEAKTVLRPKTLEKISGDNQTGQTGITLPLPLVVEVRDVNGDPVEGVTVTFTVTAGGGSLNPETAETNASGRAWTRLTPGDTAGANSVRASVAGIVQGVIFRAETTLAPPPPMLRIISGNNQTGTPGQTLEPLVVELRDRNAQPVAGFFIIFTHSDGSLSTVLDVTDSNGRAETILTLGSEVGTTTVTVVAGRASVTFEVTVTLPPTGLEKISGDNQTGHTGTALAHPFVVEVRDANGDPVADATVTFTVTGGGGSVNPETTQTNVRGRASTRLTLGDSPGTNTVTVSVGGLSQTRRFTAEATLPPPPPVLLKISGDGQIGVPGQTLEPFVVEVRDQDGDPLVGVFVVFLHDDGSLNTVLAATGSDGRAEAILTLGSDTGATTVTVQVRGVVVTFEARVLSPPNDIEIIAGDNQTGPVGGSLARPFVVEVRDENRTPMPGVTVNFTVTGGGGSLNPETTQTNARGRASSRLTLGDSLGTNTVEVSVPGLAKIVTFHAIGELLEFNLSLTAGINLIHVPLKVTTIDGTPGRIQSVGDLHDALGGTGIVNYLITYDSQAQQWRSYFGPVDRGSPADRRLADDTGILAGMRAPTSVRLTGAALGTNGSSTVTLNPGINLVGLPLRDRNISRVSDLFALPGIGGGNVPTIILTDNGEFKLVGRAGDPGDVPIAGGQSFILNASEAATVPITGTGWNNVP